MSHTGDFPRGVGHRVEKGWGLTKCAVVLLNDIIMVKIHKDVTLHKSKVEDTLISISL